MTFISQVRHDAGQNQAEDPGGLCPSVTSRRHLTSHLSFFSASFVAIYRFLVVSCVSDFVVALCIFLMSLSSRKFVPRHVT